MELATKGRLNKRSCGARGGRCIKFSSSCSASNTSAQTGSMIISRRAIWMGPNKIGIPRSSGNRSEEHTSELQSLMRSSYAVFCLKKKNKTQKIHKTNKYYQDKVQ